MPDAPVIKTSLAERIARLNQSNATGADRTTSSSRSASPGQIKAKISKYEATGQGEAPLVPKGSFGLGAPMQKGERNLDRMRIASLGVSGGIRPDSIPSSGAPGSRSVSSGANLTIPSRRGSSDSSTSAASPLPLSEDRLSSLPRSMLVAREADTESNASSLQVEAGSVRGGSRTVPSSPLPPRDKIIRSGTASSLSSRPESPHSQAGATEQDHAAQVESTRQLLEKFEADPRDPVAKGTEHVGEDLGIDGAPVEPPEVPEASPIAHISPSRADVAPVPEQDLGKMSLEDDSSSRPSGEYATGREDLPLSEDGETSSHYAYSDILDSYPAEAGPPSWNDASKGASPPGSNEDTVPKVKCSDCGALVGMLELAEHICATSPPPATAATPKAKPSNLVGASPISPLATREPLMRPPPLDVPSDEDPSDSPSATEAIESALAAAPHSAASTAASVPMPATPGTPEMPSTGESGKYDVAKTRMRTSGGSGSGGGRRQMWEDEEEEDLTNSRGYVTIVSSSRK